MLKEINKQFSFLSNIKQQILKEFSLYFKEIVFTILYLILKLFKAFTNFNKINVF